MISTYKELKIYLAADKKALGVTKHRPSFFGDEIWKIERFLRFTEYVTNIKGGNIFLKALSVFMRYRFKRMCAKRCCEIPINSIGPGLCIWHGFGIIISPKVIIGANFGVSAFCNVGHAHGKNPVIGDNVTMSLGSQVLGGISICDNVTIGAKSLVLKNIEVPYCTVGGVPAKILAVHTPESFVRG